MGSPVWKFTGRKRLSSNLNTYNQEGGRRLLRKSYLAMMKTVLPVLRKKSINKLRGHLVPEIRPHVKNWATEKEIGPNLGQLGDSSKNQLGRTESQWGNV
jgi:hypothetical protein